MRDCFGGENGSSCHVSEKAVLRSGELDLSTLAYFAVPDTGVSRRHCCDGDFDNSQPTQMLTALESSAMPALKSRRPTLGSLVFPRTSQGDQSCCRRRKCSPDRAGQDSLHLSSGLLHSVRHPY